MNYEIFILNHISRDTSDLEKRLQEDGIPYRKFTDTSQYRLIRETRYRGLLENYMRIVNEISTTEYSDSGAIIIHDDVTFSKEIYEKMCYVIDQSKKENVLAFYNPSNNSYRECNDKGKHVLKTYSNWWSQCVFFPQKVAKLVSKHFEINYGAVINIYAEDGYLSRVFSQYELPVYGIVPSLIQHYGYDKSTFGIPAKAGKNLRKSSTFHPEFEVTAVNWEKHFSNPYLDNQKKQWL